MATAAPALRDSGSAAASADTSDCRRAVADADGGLVVVRGAGGVGRSRDDLGGGAGRLSLRLLGGFTACSATGAPLKLPTRKTEACLAYLALQAGPPTPREELLRLLWSDRGIEQARLSLRQALSAIRKAWPEAREHLHTRRESVSLASGAVATDVSRFVELTRWRDTEGLNEAVGLYAGDLLAGLAVTEREFEAWRGREAGRLRRLAVETLVALLSAKDAASPEAAALAARLVEIDPLNETGHRALIAHCAARGDVDGARRRYEGCRALLDEKLGVEPSSETRRLIEQAVGKPLAPRGASDAPPVPRKPSLAVLPLSGPPEDRDTLYFAGGITEELIAAFATLPWLFVIAPGSSLALGADASDVRTAARTLGVRYLLRGSVRRTTGRVRISAQLVDADSAGVLWAGKFEDDAAAVFGLERRVVEEAVGAIEPRLEAAEVERALRRRSDNLDAWDLYLRALSHFWAMSAEGHDRALRLLDQALAVDPGYAPAAGLAAWCHTLAVPQGWAEPALAAEEGRRLARVAVARCDGDADALAMGGYAIAFLGRDYESGLAAIEEALRLNPNSARAYGFSGWVLAYLGNHAEAITRFERSLRLSPRDPLSFRVRTGLAFALMFRGRIEEAVETAERSMRENPNFSPTHRVLSAALVHSGRIEGAARAARDLARLVPGITVSYAIAETRFTREEDRALLQSGLLAAGLPA